MAFFSRSRLFGILLLTASLPFDAGAALATGLSSRPLAGDAPPPSGETASSLEERLRRIAAAVRERQGLAAASDQAGLPDDALARAFINGPRVGWANGGFRNGGWFNGGFRNGGFRNGGWFNGNAGWRNFW